MGAAVMSGFLWIYPLNESVNFLPLYDAPDSIHAITLKAGVILNVDKVCRDDDNFHT